MEYLSTLQSEHDDLKPSIFELLSEQQLSALLPPTLRYLLSVATLRQPRYLLQVLNSFDELYALLSLAVERFYLQTFGGSFTENFYGLKRERVLRIKGGEIPRARSGAARQVRENLKLRRRDVWKNLMVMVGVPYLKRKLDESYDIHAAPANSSILHRHDGPRYANQESLPPSPTIRQRIMFYYKWFLRNVYPSVNAAYYFAVLAFTLLNLFDYTKYSSPLLWLVGTRMRRMSAEDYLAIDEASQKSSSSNNAGPRHEENLFTPTLLYQRLLSGTRFLLPTSVFALKFLEWWHASDFSKQLGRKAAEDLELPPPIVDGEVRESQATKTRSGRPTSKGQTIVPKAKRFEPPISSTSLLPILTVPAPPSSELCPICLHPLSNPVVCQTGYVFDYTCIFKWLEGTHPRQAAFMAGDSMNEWEEEVIQRNSNEQQVGDNHSKDGKWEAGAGRCAVTGRRVLGGTSGLRRVMIKFKGFDNLDSAIQSSTGFNDTYYPDGLSTGLTQTDSPTTLVSPDVTSRRASAVSAKSETRARINSVVDPHTQSASQSIAEWDRIEFASSIPLEGAGEPGSGITASDFAPRADFEEPVKFAATSNEYNRKASGGSTLTTASSYIEDVLENRTTSPPSNAGTDTTLSDLNDNRPTSGRRRPPPSQHALARRAVKRQLRFMFIYPVIYVLMWTIPFVNHCFNYNDYWAEHPPYSLAILSAICTGLQAAVDSMVFTWRERPWRRPHVPPPVWIQEVFMFSRKLLRRGLSHSDNANEKRASPTTQGGHSHNRPSISHHGSRKGGTHWWEMEGGKFRKESIWTNPHGPSPTSSKASKGDR
ncbi:MAG: hypothetical protein Q9227_002678 [Pyrenula ochraceoflavens]